MYSRNDLWGCARSFPAHGPSLKAILSAFPPCHPSHFRTTRRPRSANGPALDAHQRHRAASTGLIQVSKQPQEGHSDHASTPTRQPPDPRVLGHLTCQQSPCQMWRQGTTFAPRPRAPDVVQRLKGQRSRLKTTPSELFSRPKAFPKSVNRNKNSRPARRVFAGGPVPFRSKPTKTRNTTPCGRTDRRRRVHEGTDDNQLCDLLRRDGGHI